MSKVSVLDDSQITSAAESNKDDDVLIIPGPISVNERYPLCIVWTPIPLISWILPFVGHVGICNGSDGVCFDFAGPYFINEDGLAFGLATRFLSVVPYVFKDPHYSTRLLADGSWEVKRSTTNSAGGGGASAVPTPAERLAQFDRAVLRQADRFRRSATAGNYNFFCNNCHSFVSHVLEDAGCGDFNMVRVAASVFFFGRFVSFNRLLYTVLPPLIIITIIFFLTK